MRDKKIQIKFEQIKTFLPFFFNALPLATLHQFVSNVISVDPYLSSTCELDPNTLTKKESIEFLLQDDRTVMVFISLVSFDFDVNKN